MRTIVTVMRNEGPFILEWLAYHRLIGFSDVLVYTNDCEDGSDGMLDCLAEMGLVDHIPNPRSSKKTVQWRALSRANHHPKVRRAEWVYVTDVDEFLCIHPGAGRLDDLFAACPDAAGFAIAWRMFGNNGVIAFEDRPVMEQFTRAAAADMIWPWHAVQFKSLYRPGPELSELGVHRPRGAKAKRPKAWVDGTGRPMPPYPGPILPITGPDRYALAQINHYALGSVEGFLVKSARGRPNRSDLPIDLSYWIERNYVEVEDRRILRHASAVAGQIKDWISARPELATYHQRAVAWRHNRIAALRQDPAFAALYASLIQIPASRTLPIAEQHRMLGHPVPPERR